MRVETKTFAFELKASDSEDGKTGIIRGYASTFGNIDFGGDVVMKGAFKKTLKENKNVPILADHNPSKQIGWNIRAEEDEKGLYVEGEIDLQHPDGSQKYRLAKRALDLGTKMGLSIGYQTIKAEPMKDNPMIRQLKEVKLYEYSLVTFPMNDEAMITAAKHFSDSSTRSEFIQQVRLKAKELGISMQELIEEALRKGAAVGESDDPVIDQSALNAEMDRICNFLKN